LLLDAHFPKQVLACQKPSYNFTKEHNPGSVDGAKGKNPEHTWTQITAPK
jgi:hypothetical protein